MSRTVKQGFHNLSGAAKRERWDAIDALPIGAYGDQHGLTFEPRRFKGGMVGSPACNGQWDDCRVTYGGGSKRNGPAVDAERRQWKRRERTIAMREAHADLLDHYADPIDGDDTNLPGWEQSGPFWGYDSFDPDFIRLADGTCIADDVRDGWYDDAYDYEPYGGYDDPHFAGCGCFDCNQSRHNFALDYSATDAAYEALFTPGSATYNRLTGHGW